MLRRNIWTGALGTIGVMYMTGGVFFTNYCQEMGMEDYHFSILSGLAALMAPLMLLAPAIEEHFGRRKYPWFMLHMAARLVLAPLVLGLFLSLSPRAIVALVALYTGLTCMGTALWQSWTWDYIPLAVYGRFSARRTFWIRLASAAFLLAASEVVRLTDAGTLGRRQVLSGLFLLLLVLGVVDIVCHAKIPEPPRKAPPSRIVSKLREAFKNEPLRNWLVAMGIWSFAVAIAGAFCMPYMMRDLGFENRIRLANILAGVVPTLGALATLRLWGRLLDTRHRGVVVTVCCGIWSLIPFLFFLATPANAVPMIAGAWAIGGIFPAAVMLARPLMTARLSGLEKTMPAALLLIVISVGVAAGSGVGTVIVRTHSVNHAFMASFAARLSAAFVMFLLLVLRPITRARRRALS